jgi:hypothetical protein
MKVPTFAIVVLMGLTPILLVALLVITPTLTLVVWQPPKVWSSQFGPSPGFQSGVSSVSATSDGLYAGGYLGSPLGSVNSSNSGIFVARYDLSGHQIWIRLFGNPGERVHAVKAGNGGVISAGFTNRQGFVRDYDRNGTQVWTDQALDDFYDTSEGGSAVYAVGYYRATNVLFIYELQSFDLKGRFLWNSTINHHCLDCRNVNVYASSVGIYVSSSDYAGGLSDLQLYYLNGTLKWTHQLDCASCSATGVSGDGTAVYVAGYVNPVSSNAFYLNKYDLAGNQLWTHQFTTDYPSGRFVHMIADSSGIYLAIEGINGGGSIARYDGGGSQVWSFGMKATPFAVSGGGDGVYVGGGTGGSSIGSFGAAYAFLTAFGQSSSLIFFGLNPPFSFGLVALIAGAAVTAVWWLRRHYENKEKLRSPGKAFLKSKGVPTDALGMILGCHL